ncbi:MAG TPA: hypothetical protein VNC12_00060 [Solirubrobacteraceae bacterium]|nr:hypothetical protein [Solirubrobacteraceae bacterium]
MTTEPTPERVQPPAAAPARRSSRFRERSLLLNPAPVIGATLAAFAIAFGGLTVQLVSGRDPAVGTLASVTRGAASGGTTTVTTRASGAASATGAAPGTSGAASGSSATGKLTTATSGSAAAGGTRSIGRDDAA